MNLTKTLCKYFDKNQKGYMNIGDILNPIFWYALICTGVYIILYTVYEGILLILSGRIFHGELYTTDDFIGTVGCAFILIIVAIIFFVSICYISNIKIAKCEYKSDNEDKQHEM